MPPAHLVVVEIMGRGNFDTTGAKFAVYIIIGDYRYFAIAQRQYNGASNQIRVALVFRVNRYCAVAQHGLRASGGDCEMALTASQWIVEVPHVALLLFGDDLKVGDSGMKRWIPVNQPLATVNEALPVEPDKHLLHRCRESRVHGEALARPV